MKLQISNHGKQVLKDLAWNLATTFVIVACVCCAIVTVCGIFATVAELVSNSRIFSTDTFLFWCQTITFTELALYLLWHTILCVLFIKDNFRLVE